MSEQKKGMPSWLRITIGVFAGFGLLVIGLIAVAAIAASRTPEGSVVVEPTEAPSPRRPTVSSFMASIEQQVAKDSEAQYGIAKRGGDPIETCVHAGMVAAAYLQAKDEPNYQKWKAVEKADCAAAGMAR